MNIAPTPTVPNLPLAPPTVDAMFINQYSNVLRLYFNQLQNTTTALQDAQASASTMAWLGSCN